MLLCISFPLIWAHIWALKPAYRRLKAFGCAIREVTFRIKVDNVLNFLIYRAFSDLVEKISGVFRTQSNNYDKAFFCENSLNC